MLFRDDLPDWHNNACLNATWGVDQAAYLEGYRCGARLLVEHVTEHARDQDFLVYPIIFLYRHHVELALKNIILQALPPDVKRVNLRHFAETIERLADYFEGLDAAICSLADAKVEMEAEYQREAAYYMDYE